jgi:ribonuclease HI
MGSNLSNSKAKYKNKSKKRNREINSRRKESCNPVRKRKTILPHKFDDFQVELYRSIGSETESETSERISNRPKEMVKLYEKQTSNLKEITAIYLALHHFLPLIKKSRYKNILIRTDNTAAMYNINKNEPILHSEEDMEIIRKKLLNIKRSTYVREDKCGDRQIELFGNEQKLSVE